VRASLFDRLYQNIDISAGAKAEAPEDPTITPAQRTPETQDVAQQKVPKNITGMKFTHSLIKHLDMLYSKMLAGEVAEIASEPKNDPKQKVIVGQTDAIVLNEKESFFNPGNSAVTESM
tara:strand:+ start:335 stop:691 length:357 start_codon:yes stop_codon:yes gene_type:complete